MKSNRCCKTIKAIVLALVASGSMPTKSFYLSTQSCHFNLVKNTLTGEPVKIPDGLQCRVAVGSDLYGGRNCIASYEGEKENVLCPELKV